jgi:hypothetical protein
VPRALLGACVAGLAFAGAAGYPQPATAAGAQKGQTFSRLLVVGLSPDINQRCAFETALADSLQSATVTAKTSCNVLGTKEPLTRENVERGIADIGADAVLATRLVDSSMQLKEGGTGETQGGGRYKATDLGYGYGYWGVYGVPVVYGEFQATPSLFTVKGTVRIRSDLFETGGATLVHTVETKAKDLESRVQGIFEVTAAIAKRLRREGLIR